MSIGKVDSKTDAGLATGNQAEHARVGKGDRAGQCEPWLQLQLLVPSKLFSFLLVC